MTKSPDWLSRLKTFWSRDLWKMEPGDLDGGRKFLLRGTQVLSLAARDFVADGCLLRASALTYTTLLSIVPLLALMFSVLKGFGVQNALEPLLIKQIAVGSEQIVQQIMAYIENTNVGRLGAVGLLVLVIAVLALLSNIEESFNHIWGVQETRSIFRRFSDYFSVVILGPVFIFVAITMTTTLQSQAFIQSLIGLAYVGDLIMLGFRVLPYLAMWAAFTFLYLFMPNSRVSFRAAVVGGIFGGTLWQLSQWGYVTFQFGVARYNAIYGTMAALPIFMVWLYLSWLIVLFGLEVAYATQNQRSLRREMKIRSDDVNFASRELVILCVLVVVAETFHRGDPPWSQEKIIVELDLPPRLASEILDDMVRLKLLSEVRTSSGQFAFQPACEPQNLPVHRIIEILEEDGVSYTELGKTPEREAVREIEQRLRQAGREALDGLTLQDLVEQMIAREEGKDQGERERASS